MHPVQIQIKIRTARICRQMIGMWPAQAIQLQQQPHHNHPSIPHQLSKNQKPHPAIMSAILVVAMKVAVIKLFYKVSANILLHRSNEKMTILGIEFIKNERKKNFHCVISCLVIFRAWCHCEHKTRTFKNNWRYNIKWTYSATTKKEKIIKNYNRNINRTHQLYRYNVIHERK